MIKSVFSKLRFAMVATLVLWWWVAKRPLQEDKKVVEPMEITVPDDLTESSMDEDIPPAEKIEIKEALPTKKSANEVVETYQMDDLTRIDGLGPKTHSALKDAGITHFEQLAQMEIAQIQTILDEAGLRLVRPGTWPEQAQLAAAGDWEGLKTLQSQLKASHD